MNLSKTLSKKEWLLLLVLAAPFVYLAVVWREVPDRVPVHFNANFRPDGWMGKTAGLLLLPGSMIFVTALSAVLLRYDPRLAKNDPETRAHVWRVMLTTLIATNLLLAACSVSIVWASWGNLDVIAWCIRLGLPLVLLALGNSLGKLRPNYAIGIRVRWTLESDAVWSRTHRFAGKVLVTLALALLLSVLCGVPAPWFTWMLLGTLLGWAAVSVGYAFLLSKKEVRVA